MTVEFNFHELKTSNRLPSPSGTALAIMQLVKKEDTTLQEVAQLVKVDPALSGRILSFSNSAAFGARRPIANIGDAVMMMGMQTVRNFALSLSLVSNDNKSCHCPGFDYEAYWSESLAIGVALAAITALEATVTPEEAFTLGLLSEIGQLALATAWSEVYSECLQHAKDGQLLAMERERFAIDHNALSLMLLSDWGLPVPFIDALSLSYEDTPELNEDSRSGRLARQLLFARQLAWYCVVNDHYKSILFPELERVSASHGMDPSMLSKFLEDVIAAWHEWGKLINVKTDLNQAYEAQSSNADAIKTGVEVLLVEGDVQLAESLSRQLQESGYRVSACQNSESALKYIFASPPQIVIIDSGVKSVDGLTLSRQLRASPVSDIYMIMLSDSVAEEDQVQAFEAGVDDYIAKPVNSRVLLARIRAGERFVALQNEVAKERKDIQNYTRELAAANRRLETMANTDILTRLPNRRYALNRLDQEWTAAVRYKKPLSVLMLDIDYFKSVNDSLGHEAGDQVLAHTAKIIRDALRTSDVACRLGGEEFLVIATNTDGHTAFLLGERIRKAVEKNQPKGLVLKRPVTVSVGVAGSVDAKKSWNDLIRIADHALYKVKKSTRNAVEVVLV